MFIPEFMDVFIADRPAGGFDQPGINGNAFIDIKAFLFELPQDGGGLPRYKF
jgi:hypothetical protein